jgi:hypothetical protein
MPITMIRAIHACQVKVEVTEGTDVTPGAGDSLQLAEPGQIIAGSEIVNDRDDFLNGLIDAAKPLSPGGLFAEYTGKIYLRGFGSAYSAGNKPEIDAVLQAFGLSSTGSFVGGSESYTYDTVSVSMKTVTVYAFEGLETNVWVKHMITAGRCTKLVFEGRAGEPLTCTFTIRGIYNEPTDASPVTPTYQTAIPPILGGTTAFALGTYAAPITRSVTVTLDNTVVPRLNANVPGHLAGYLQSRRKISFDARVEAQRVADYNAYNKWAAAFTDTFAFKHPGGAGGGTQYNRLTIDGTTATITAPPAYEDERGLWIRTLSGVLSPEGANRCRIVFT